MIRALEVLNSGGQLQISRPAPEPPRTNGGSNVYQQPHQHVNSNGTYGEYVGQRQSEEEGMYEQYQQSSMSDQYDMRHHEERMYAERGNGHPLQQHHSSPNMSQPQQQQQQQQQQPTQAPQAPHSPVGGPPGHHRTNSAPPIPPQAPGQQYAPTSQYNGSAAPPNQYNGSPGPNGHYNGVGQQQAPQQPQYNGHQQQQQQTYQAAPAPPP